MNRVITNRLSSVPSTQGTGALLPSVSTSCGRVRRGSSLGEGLWALVCFHFLLWVKMFRGDSIQMERILIQRDNPRFFQARERFGDLTPPDLSLPLGETERGQDGHDVSCDSVVQTVCSGGWLHQTGRDKVFFSRHNLLR